MRLIRIALASGMAMLIAVAAQADDTPVDLQLVLAIDVSKSVDRNEASLQRNGYVRAFSDPQVIAAILSGPHGRIAVTYWEWSGPNQQSWVVDWRILDSAEAAQAFSKVLSERFIARGENTSISGAIYHFMALFDVSHAQSDRRVIDISGDGPNNTGEIVRAARKAAVAAGITINGVAINSTEPSGYSLPDLDVYYRECVIGGPGSFVIAADGFESFADAIRRKLIAEVANRPSDLIFVQATPPAAGGQKYGPRCDIGERMRRIDGPIERP
jgi:hypothetical protein